MLTNETLHYVSSQNKVDICKGDSGSIVFRYGDFLFKTGLGHSAVRLRSQVEWWSRLPKDFKKVFPYIYSFGDTDNQFWICMENLNMATLSDELYRGNMDEGHGIKVLNQVQEWLFNHLWQSTIPAMESSLLLLLSQMEDRHQQMLESDNQIIRYLVQADKIKVNNRIIHGGLSSINQLFRMKHYLKEISPNNMVLAHGDLHTGNILCDKDRFKLIDQRGNFHNNNLYFDVCYDSGKLLHDLHAFYTLIRKGDFRLSCVSNKEFSFHIIKTEKKKIYNKLFDWYLDWCEVKRIVHHDSNWWLRSFLFEALLLCGIVPFHLHNTERAIVLYLSGLVLLNRWLDCVNGRRPSLALFEDLER